MTSSRFSKTEKQNDETVTAGRTLCDPLMRLPKFASLFGQRISSYRTFLDDQNTRIRHPLYTKIEKLIGLFSLFFPVVGMEILRSNENRK